MLKLLASILAPWFDAISVRCCKKETAAPTVLIVRLDAIGDFVLWLSSAKALFEHYKSQGNTVVLLGNKAWAPWANQLGIADSVWALEPTRYIKSPRYRASWNRRVRQSGFSTVIHPTYSREFLTGDAIVRASDAAVRIGSVGDYANTKPLFKHWADKWYTQLIAADSQPRMELQRHAEFLQGVTGIKHPAVIPVLPKSPPALKNKPQAPYVVLFPAASWTGRMWPSERFIEIGRRFFETGRHVVIAGGPGDHPFCDPVIQGLGSAAVDMVAKTSLPELAELLGHADLVVTNETSAAHIAAAASTPVLVILGGGHYGRFAPYKVDMLHPGQLEPKVAAHPMPCFNCNWRCIYPREEGRPVRCIENIEVEQVWKQAIQVLRTA